MPKDGKSNRLRTMRAVGTRWPVEESFELGKDCFGLDQCQARLYTAILRHFVLVMAALAICAVTAATLRNQTDAQAPPPGARHRRGARLPRGDCRARPRTRTRPPGPRSRG